MRRFAFAAADASASVVQSASVKAHLLFATSRPTNHQAQLTVAFNLHPSQLLTSPPLLRLLQLRNSCK